jgi:uncharacterized membrane protein YvbJ
MNICSKCGSEFTDEKNFCTQCGNNLREENTNKVESSRDENSVVIKPEESRITKLKLRSVSKIAMLLFPFLILASFTIIKVSNSINDPYKLVTRFQKDVASNNTSDLASILYSNDASLKVDSTSITPLLSYFKSNPAYLNKVIDSLKNDAIYPKDINSLSKTSSNTLTLSNTGKIFLFISNYKINIKPSFIEIGTTVKDVTFSINNTQIGKSATDKSIKKYGPYIPGNYSITANYKGKYVALTKPYPVDLVSDKNGTTNVNIFSDLTYLNISSNCPDAEIFVDEKDVNVKVKDAMKFGPVNSSSKIYATYVKDSNTLKSEEYTITGSDTDLYLNLEDYTGSQYPTADERDPVDLLNELLDNYASSFTQAINTNNISLIDSYVASGSELDEMQQSYIPKAYTAGMQENFISADVIKYNFSEDRKSGSISSTEVYTLISKDGTSSNKTFNYEYEFEYNNSISNFQLTKLK